MCARRERSCSNHDKRIAQSANYGAKSDPEWGSGAEQLAYLASVERCLRKEFRIDIADLN